MVEVPVDAVLLQLGFKTALGPLKEWPLEIEKGAIKVDSVMRTSMEGVWAAGDITTFDSKPSSSPRASPRPPGDRPGRPPHPARDEDPAEVLDEHRGARGRRGQP